MIGPIDVMSFVLAAILLIGIAGYAAEQWLVRRRERRKGEADRERCRAAYKRAWWAENGWRVNADRREATRLKRAGRCCEDCGESIADRPGHARRCRPCVVARAKVMGAARQRAYRARQRAKGVKA